VGYVDPGSGLIALQTFASVRRHTPTWFAAHPRFFQRKTGKHPPFCPSRPSQVTPAKSHDLGVARCNIP